MAAAGDADVASSLRLVVLLVQELERGPAPRCLHAVTPSTSIHRPSVEPTRTTLATAWA